MARTDADLFEVTLDLTARVSLDMERIESDPVYHLCLIDAPCLEHALEAYLLHYISRERFFTQVPSTNGPGYFTVKGIEGIHAPKNSTD